MKKSAVGSKSAEQIAYDEIITLIMRGILRPGNRIIEQQVANQLEISRTPVRNAMRTLSSEGLLENRGTGGYLLPALSLKDLYKLYKVKLLFEPKIAYEAALNADDMQKKFYVDLLQKEREYFYKGRQDIYKINKEIHYGIASLTSNKYMLAFQEQTFWRSEIYILFFNNFYYATSSLPLLRDPDYSASHVGHAELINAIFTHNQELAEITMKKHLTETWEMLKANIISTKNSYGQTLITDWDFNLPALP